MPCIKNLPIKIPICCFPLQINVLGCSLIHQFYLNHYLLSSVKSLSWITRESSFPHLSVWPTTLANTQFAGNILQVIFFLPLPHHPSSVTTTNQSWQRFLHSSIEIPVNCFAFFFFFFFFCHNLVFKRWSFSIHRS